MKQIKKYPYLFLFIGVLLIAAGILIVFVFTDLRDSIMNIAIGLIIMILALFLILPSLKKHRQGPIFILRAIELVLALLAGLLFILGTASGNPSLWFGLLLYIHGLVELIAAHMHKVRLKTEQFIVAIVLVTVGTYVFAANPVTATIMNAVLLALFVVPGLFLVINTLPVLNTKTPAKSKTKKS
jgi:uncharacterized membrane protein HdeD (DUF308 family)